MHGEKWDRHFLKMALAHSCLSKDPSKRVGAAIIGPDKEIVSVGFNGLPRGIEDTPERLDNKELKRKLIVHAELNAILAVARIGGPPLLGKTMYIVCEDEAGIWGGPPCVRCAVETIQAGIAHVVTFPPKPGSSWNQDLEDAYVLLSEAGVSYREYQPE